VIGTNSSSSNFLLAGCFSEDHFPKYLTSLVFWPLLAWYATRLRRLQGKALMMSTSLTEWNLDVYELSAQDESKFSMHNGNYIQRAYVFLCVSTLLANVVLWSEPARLSVVFFILSLLVWALFAFYRPYFDSRMNAFRTSLNTLVVLNNGMALFHVFDPSQYNNDTPILIFYVLVVPLLVVVYYAHMRIFPYNTPDKQLLAAARDVKLNIAMLKANHTPSRRVAMKFCAALAKTSNNMEPLQLHLRYFESLMVASDSVVAYYALVVVKLCCRAKDTLSTEYFQAQQSSGKTFRLAKGLLQRHLEGMGRVLTLGLLQWLRNLIMDQDYGYREHLQDLAVFDASLEMNSVRVSKSTSRSTSILNVHDNVDTFDVSSYEGNIFAFKRSMVTGRSVSTSTSLSRLPSSTSSSMLDSHDNESSLFQMLVEAVEAQAEERGGIDRGSAKVMCQLVVFLAYDVVQKHDSTMPVDGAGGTSTGNGSASTVRAKDIEGEGWVLVPNYQRILTMADETLSAPKQLGGSQTLSDKVEAWMARYIGDSLPTSDDAVVKKASALFTDPEILGMPREAEKRTKMTLRRMLNIVRLGQGR
jgi:hypothetical protein